MKLAYVRLLVRDFDACVEFYRDTLGFPVSILAEHAKFAEFATGETALELYDRGMMAEIVGRTDAGDSGGADRVLLTLSVDDVDETYEALKSKGVKLDVPPTDREAWGARTAHFRDPDGHLIELFQHAHAHPHE
jgi:catechol 2,3-dioxygenase-like lactoylglutathione lyase family enzyme